MVGAEALDGAGEGVDVVGAAAVRLLESLADEEVRFDLKALIWLSKYDILTAFLRSISISMLAGTDIVRHPHLRCRSGELHCGVTTEESTIY